MANFEGLDDALLSNRCGSIKALLTYKLQNDKTWSNELLEVLKDCNSLIDKILIDQDKEKVNEI
jgi:hypothetical protein|tara:strand:+ start:356 stop:547 length:192 start_codon:yes stop_codon:yes gene_type:complete